MAFDFFVQDNEGNLVDNPMCTVFTATTNSSGEFTVDMTNASLTHIHTAHVSTVAAGTAVTNMGVCNITSLSTTSISGIAYLFTSLLGVLGLTASNGQTVYVTVIGDQD